MLYVEIDIETGRAARVLTNDQVHYDPKASREDNETRAIRAGLAETRNDWKTFEQAAQRAAELTEAGQGHFIPTDSGPHCYPRYDVVEVPKIGDDCSYGFNGDYYPCGKIVAISKTLKKITTRTEAGHEMHFYRVKQTGSWREGGTWSLVKGIHNERNPHF